jgi:P27 family predicted phage terminase small subunit
MPRGRPPKPTAEKRRKGNPGRRPLPANEPQPPPGRPPRPAFLTGRALEIFEHLAAELETTKILTTVDGYFLAAFAQRFATWEALEASLEKTGRILTYRDETGAVKWTAPDPATALAAKALEQAKTLGGLFGLTPADRARLGGPITKSKAAAPDTTDEDPAIVKMFA